MSRLLILRDEADEDLTAIYEYLLNVSERTLHKFEARLDALFDRILEMPFVYAKVWRTVRAVRVRGFQYVAYYIVRSKWVEVIAVVRGAQESSVWKSRA
jgi:plasmid stabilization system protein ParE